jgi:hypothetical protein
MSGDFNPDTFKKIILDSSKLTEESKKNLYSYLTHANSDNLESVIAYINNNSSDFNLSSSEAKKQMIALENHTLNVTRKEETDYKNMIKTIPNIPYKKDFLFYRKKNFYRNFIKKYKLMLKYKSPDGAYFDTPDLTKVAKYLDEREAELSETQKKLLRGLKNHIFITSQQQQQQKSHPKESKEVKVPSESKKSKNSNPYQNARPVSLVKIGKAQQAGNRSKVIPYNFDAFTAKIKLHSSIKDLLRSGIYDKLVSAYNSIKSNFIQTPEKKVELKPYMEGLRLVILRKKPKSKKYKRYKEFYNTISWEKHFSPDGFPKPKYEAVNNKTGKTYRKNYSVYQLATMYMFSIGFDPDKPGFDTAFKRIYQTLIQIYVLRNVPNSNEYTSVHRETMKLYFPDKKSKNLILMPGTQFQIHKLSRLKVPFNIYAHAYMYFNGHFLENVPRMGAIKNFKKAFVDICKSHGNFRKLRKYTINTDKLKLFKMIAKESDDFKTKLKTAYNNNRLDVVNELLLSKKYARLDKISHKVTFETNQCTLPTFLRFCFRQGIAKCQDMGATIAKRSYGRDLTRYANAVREKDTRIVEKKFEQHKAKEKKKEEKKLQRRQPERNTKGTNQAIEKIKKSRAKKKSSSSEVKVPEPVIQAASSSSEVNAPEPVIQAASSSSEVNVTEPVIQAASSSSEVNVPEPVIQAASSSSELDIPVSVPKPKKKPKEKPQPRVQPSRSAKKK